MLDASFETTRHRHAHHISKMESLASENKIQNYFTSSEEKEDKQEGYDITEVSLCL